MKYTLKKLVAIVMALLMLLEAAPISALAEKTQTITSTGKPALMEAKPEEKTESLHPLTDEEMIVSTLESERLDALKALLPDDALLPVAILK